MSWQDAHVRASSSSHQTTQNVMRGELKTTAVPPEETPWPMANTWRRHNLPRAVSTSAFALETRTLAGLWQSRLGFRLCPPVGQPLPRPGDITELKVDIPDAGAYGFDLSRVVGVALVSPNFVVENAAALRPPASLPSSSSNNNLRGLLLAKERQANGDVHLFSCVQWRTKVATASILIPKKDLRELVQEGYHFVLLRTDNWVALASPVALANTPMGAAAAAERQAVPMAVAVGGGGGGSSRTREENNEE